MRNWMTLLFRQTKSWIVYAETLCFIICANPCFAAYTRRRGQSAWDAILGAAVGGAGVAFIFMIIQAIVNWFKKK